MSAAPAGHWARGRLAQPRAPAVKDFWDFLRAHKVAWIVPIVLFAVVAGLIAWKIATTPAHPFAYDLR